MARLPSPEQIGVSTPRARGGPPNRPSPSARLDTGMHEMGQALFEAGIDLQKDREEREERDKRAEVQRAKAVFLTRKVEVMDSLHDNDYGTYGDRYRAGIGKAVADAAEGISDPDRRSLFEAELQPQVAAGYAVVHERSLGVEKDFRRAELEDQLGRYGQTFSGGTPDNRLAALEASNELIQSRLDSGAISAGQARLLREEQSRNYAMASYLSEPSDAARLAALNEGDKGRGYAAFLPPVERARLKSQAKALADEEGLLAGAQTRVETWAAEGKTIAQMYTEARKLSGKEQERALGLIDNRRIRDAAVRVPDERKRLDEILDEAREAGGVSGLSKASRDYLIMQGMMGRFEKRFEQAQLSPDELEQREARMSQIRTQAHTGELRITRTDEDGNIVPISKAEFIAEVAPEDQAEAEKIYDAYRGAEVQGRIDRRKALENATVVTAAQVTNTARGVAFDLGITGEGPAEDARRNRIERELTALIEQFKRLYKKEPTPTEVERLASEMKRNVVLNSWRTREAKLYGFSALTPEQVSRWRDDTQVPRQDRQRIIEKFLFANQRTPSEDEILRYYWIDQIGVDPAMWLQERGLPTGQSNGR